MVTGDIAIFTNFLLNCFAIWHVLLSEGFGTQGHVWRGDEGREGAARVANTPSLVTSPVTSHMEGFTDHYTDDCLALLPLNYHSNRLWVLRGDNCTAESVSLN